MSFKGRLIPWVPIHCKCHRDDKSSLYRRQVQMNDHATQTQGWQGILHSGQGMPVEDMDDNAIRRQQ